MTDVQFTGEETPSVQSQAPRQPRGLYKLVISLGLAKDETSASAMLVVIAIIAILIGVIYPFLIA